MLFSYHSRGKHMVHFIHPHNHLVLRAFILISNARWPRFFSIIFFKVINTNKKPSQKNHYTEESKIRGHITNTNNWKQNTIGTRVWCMCGVFVWRAQQLHRKWLLKQKQKSPNALIYKWMNDRWLRCALVTAPVRHRLHTRTLFDFLAYFNELFSILLWLRLLFSDVSFISNSTKQL